MAFETWKALTLYLVFNSLVFLQGALMFGMYAIKLSERQSQNGY